MPGVDDLALEACRAAVAPDVSSVFEGFVGLVKEGVEVADAVEGHAVDDQLRVVPAQVVKGVAVVGVDDEGAVVETLAVVVEPVDELLAVQVQSGLEDGFEVLVGDEVVFEFGAGVHTVFGPVAGNEAFLVVLEGDYGFGAAEEFHRPRVSVMV